MPYPTKIQPVDFNDPPEWQPKCDAVVNPVSKSRFMRLFEKPFSSVLKTPAPEKLICAPRDGNKDGSDEFEPSSLCLAKMVQNFIEESNDKPQRCGKNRCYCFRENSDEENDSYYSSFIQSIDVLKNLIQCVSISEKNLLADASKIVERNKINKRKDESSLKTIADSLINLGYDASICKSKWEKCGSLPAGEHQFIDVITESNRLILAIDFRSEFEIARSTKAYKQILQTLPTIFVGKSDRLEKIITIVSESARESLKKKGMPFPPWRKPEYVKAKWLSPFTTRMFHNNTTESGENPTPAVTVQPLEIKPKILKKGVKMVTGLTAVIEGISN